MNKQDPVVRGTDKSKAIRYDKIIAIIDLYGSDDMTDDNHMDDVDCLTSIMDVCSDG